MKLKKQYARMLKEREMLKKVVSNPNAPIEILGKAFKKLDAVKDKIEAFEEKYIKPQIKEK